MFMNGNITADMMIEQLKGSTNLELKLIKLICIDLLNERKGDEE
jgi:NifU-like protein involved in Fe-S cluster formation